MNLSIYLTPVNLNELKHERWGNYSLGKSVSFYQGEEDGEVHLRDYNIAIVGICEERNAVNNDGCGSAPNSVRNYLYQLSAISGINNSSKTTKKCLKIRFKFIADGLFFKTIKNTRCKDTILAH